MMKAVGGHTERRGGTPIHNITSKHTSIHLDETQSGSEGCDLEKERGKRRNRIRGFEVLTMKP